MILSSAYLLVFLPWILQKKLVKDVRESDLYGRLIWPWVIFWLGQQFDSPTLFMALITVWALASLLDVLYCLTFKSAFNQGAIEAIFLSNPAESKEFVLAYFSPANILSVILYLCLLGLAWLYIPLNWHSSDYHWAIDGLSLVLLVYVAVMIIWQHA